MYNFWWILSDFFVKICSIWQSLLSPKESLLTRLQFAQVCRYMEHGTRDMGHGTQDTGHGTHDTGWVTRDTGHGTLDMGHGTGHGTLQCIAGACFSQKTYEFCRILGTTGKRHDTLSRPPAYWVLACRVHVWVCTMNPIFCIVLTNADQLWNDIIKMLCLNAYT